MPVCWVAVCNPNVDNTWDPNCVGQRCAPTSRAGQQPVCIDGQVSEMPPFNFRGRTRSAHTICKPPPLEGSKKGPRFGPPPPSRPRSRSNNRPSRPPPYRNQGGGDHADTNYNMRLPEPNERQDHAGRRMRCDIQACQTQPRRKPRRWMPRPCTGQSALHQHRAQRPVTFREWKQCSVDPRPVKATNSNQIDWWYGNTTTTATPSPEEPHLQPSPEVVEPVDNLARHSDTRGPKVTNNASMAEVKRVSRSPSKQETRKPWQSVFKTTPLHCMEDTFTNHPPKKKCGDVETVVTACGETSRLGPCEKFYSSREARRSRREAMERGRLSCKSPSSDSVTHSENHIASNEDASYSNASVHELDPHSRISPSYNNEDEKFQSAPSGSEILTDTQTGDQHANFSFKSEDEDFRFFKCGSGDFRSNKTYGNENERRMSFPRHESNDELKGTRNWSQADHDLDYNQEFTGLTGSSTYAHSNEVSPVRLRRDVCRNRSPGVPYSVGKSRFEPCLSTKLKAYDTSVMDHYLSKYTSVTDRGRPRRYLPTCYGTESPSFTSFWKPDSWREITARQSKVTFDLPPNPTCEPFQNIDNSHWGEQRADYSAYDRKATYDMKYSSSPIRLRKTDLGLASHPDRQSASVDQPRINTSYTICTSDEYIPTGVAKSHTKPPHPAYDKHPTQDTHRTHDKHSQPPQPTYDKDNQPPQPTYDKHNQHPKPTYDKHSQPPQPTYNKHSQPPQPTYDKHSQPPQPTYDKHCQSPQPTYDEHNLPSRLSYGPSNKHPHLSNNQHNGPSMSIREHRSRPKHDQGYHRSRSKVDLRENHSRSKDNLGDPPSHDKRRQKPTDREHDHPVHSGHDARQHPSNTSHELRGHPSTSAIDQRGHHPRQIYDQRDQPSQTTFDHREHTTQTSPLDHCNQPSQTLPDNHREQPSQTSQHDHREQPSHRFDYNCEHPSQTSQHDHREHPSQTFDFNCEQPSQTSQHDPREQPSQTFDYNCEQPSQTSQNDHREQPSQTFDYNCEQPSQTFDYNYEQPSQTFDYNCEQSLQTSDHHRNQPSQTTFDHREKHSQTKHDHGEQPSQMKHGHREQPSQTTLIHRVQSSQTINDQSPPVYSRPFQRAPPTKHPNPPSQQSRDPPNYPSRPPYDYHKPHSRQSYDPPYLSRPPSAYPKHYSRPPCDHYNPPSQLSCGHRNYSSRTENDHCHSRSPSPVDYHNQPSQHGGNQFSDSLHSGYDRRHERSLSTCDHDPHTAYYSLRTHPSQSTCGPRSYQSACQTDYYSMSNGECSVDWNDLPRLNKSCSARRLPTSRSRSQDCNQHHRPGSSPSESPSDSHDLQHGSLCRERHRHGHHDRRRSMSPTAAARTLSPAARDRPSLPGSRWRRVDDDDLRYVPDWGRQHVADRNISNCTPAKSRARSALASVDWQQFCPADKVLEASPPRSQRQWLNQHMELMDECQRQRHRVTVQRMKRLATRAEALRGNTNRIHDDFTHIENKIDRVAKLQKSFLEKSEEAVLIARRDEAHCACPDRLKHGRMHNCGY